MSHRSEVAIAKIPKFSTRQAFDANASVRWPSGAAQLRAPRTMLLSTTVPLLSARFQSTSPLPRSNVADLATHQSPTSSSTEVWTASSDPLAATTSTSLDHLDFPTTSGGLVSVEPHIGYLKELGLDFGWGPTAIVEWAYEHIHVLAGTPWWGSILITCALYRVLILAYPQLVQSDQMARTAAMKDVMKEPNQRFMDAMKSGNQYEMQTAQAELRQIKSASGISSLKAMWGPIIQGFLGYGTFNLMRSMSNLPVPGLQTGGFLWITDLTVADPFFIMPVALSATMFYLMKVGDLPFQVSVVSSVIPELWYSTLSAFTSIRKGLRFQHINLYGFLIVMCFSTPS